jgi:hypothetical protein
LTFTQCGDCPATCIASPQRPEFSTQSAARPPPFCRHLLPADGQQADLDSTDWNADKLKAAEFSVTLSARSTSSHPWDEVDHAQRFLPSRRLERAGHGSLGLGGKLDFVPVDENAADDKAHNGEDRQHDRDRAFELLDAEAERIGAVTVADRP